MRIKLSTPVLAVAAFVLAAAGGGSSYALWNAGQQIDPAVITSGNLSIEEGGATWWETSADVAAAPHIIDPETFLVRQGDSFAARYGFTTHMQGENLVGELSVAWPTATPDLPEGATGSYALYLGDDPATRTELLSPTSLGTPSEVTETRLAASNLTSTSTIILEVTLDFSEMDDRRGATTLAQAADIGALELTLEQRRTGDGFQ